MITATRGQWFPITISNIQYGGGADFDLQGAADVKAALVSSLGTRAGTRRTLCSRWTGALEEETLLHSSLLLNPALN